MTEASVVALSLWALSLAAVAGTVAAEDGVVVPLWPKDALEPGALTQPEKVAVETKRGRPITRITNVANPTITVHKPKDTAATDAAVIVCPGGGYAILAHDLEGTEVVAWLNSLGLTGVLLKYRVPRQRDAAFADGQRAVSLVRSRAKEWGLHPRRIGILGFSAGGHLAARVCTGFGARSYKPVDAHDEASCRPDFAVLIYPAYLATADDSALDAATLPVTAETPSTFVAIAFDDKFTPGALHYFVALRKARVRSELHVFASGRHGCGLREDGTRLPTWPAHCERWLRELSVLPAKE